MLERAYSHQPRNRIRPSRRCRCADGSKTPVSSHRAVGYKIHSTPRAHQVNDEIVRPSLWFAPCARGTGRFSPDARRCGSAVRPWRLQKLGLAARVLEAAHSGSRARDPCASRRLVRPLHGVLAHRVEGLARRSCGAFVPSQPRDAACNFTPHRNNWLLFIWAVTHGEILASSLGYFLNPLVNVALAVVFLRERLRPWQVAAVALAGVGVVPMAASAGGPPWISLALALSFGLYGLLRKVAPMAPLISLSIETALLCPVAAVYLAWQGARGESSLARGDAHTALLLILPASSRRSRSCGLQVPPSDFRFRRSDSFNISLQALRARTVSPSGASGPLSSSIPWTPCGPSARGAADNSRVASRLSCLRPSGSARANGIVEVSWNPRETGAEGEGTITA